MPKCDCCKKETAVIAIIVRGWKLCKKCRGQLRAARKREKRNGQAASYYEALTHPEYRGLRGVRK